MPRTILSLPSIAACALLAAPAFAQAPVNDLCVNALPITLGANGPFDNTGATEDPLQPVPCSSGGYGDIWFTFTPSSGGIATIDTCTPVGTLTDTILEVFTGTCGSLTSIACNDDFCSFLSQVEFPATGGTTYYVRAGSWSTTTRGTFSINVAVDYGVDLVGSVNALPLGPNGGAFTGGDTLNFNYLDPAGNANGKLAAVVLNLGEGPMPLGTTAAIPGFQQLWLGSTPSGFALPVALLTLPAADQTWTIPVWAFNPGGTVRLQGLILDPPAAPGTLPVVPTRNVVDFVAYGPALPGTAEGFETWTAGGPPYMNGWTDGGGVLQWQVDSAGTPSGGTGPSAAFEGVNYIYCETSGTRLPTDTWIINSPVFPSAGVSAVAFQLSRVGTGMGTLEVRMDDGSGTFSTLLGTYAGEGVEWELVVLPIGTSPPANVQFQFHYTFGTDFRGDIAIDAFELQ